MRGHLEEIEAVQNFGDLPLWYSWEWPSGLWMYLKKKNTTPKASFTQYNGLVSLLFLLVEVLTGAELWNIGGLLEQTFYSHGCSDGECRKSCVAIGYLLVSVARCRDTVFRCYGGVCLATHRKRVTAAGLWQMSGVSSPDLLCWLSPVCFNKNYLKCDIFYNFGESTFATFCIQILKKERKKRTLPTLFILGY